MHDQFIRHLAELPLIAILRGITPEECAAVGPALAAAGFRLVEVPLNSPRPLESIRRLAEACGPSTTIGAGTVLRPADVESVKAAGATFVVSPNADGDVIRATVAAGLASGPGVATPTEGFMALEAGADFLKVFPAEQVQPAVLRAWRAVFPAGAWLVPVGGITPDNLAAYVAAGASGFGLGSALYKPGMTVDEIGRHAARFVAAWRAAG